VVLKKEASAKKTYQGRPKRVGSQLVEETLAADGTTETRDTVRSVHFTLEFVVVCEFLVYSKFSFVTCSVYNVNDLPWLMSRRA
jgi:hypothetical protein